MNWINRLLPNIATKARKGKKRVQIPIGIWQRCGGCRSPLYRQILEENLNVCPKCEFHMPVSARQRLQIFLDDGETEAIAADVKPVDRLEFKDVKPYQERLAAAQKNTGENDALIVERGLLYGQPLVAAAFEFKFLGGSMGSAVGECFAQAVQRSLDEGIPLVNFAASGGARMQEALISLVQMAKTSAILQKLRDKGIPYISVLTDPVYGGVSASLASLGDICISEPRVRAGFAGPNIIRETMRVKELPEGFQSAEFLLEHGAIDMIVSRAEMRQVIASLLSKLTGSPEPGGDR